MQDTGIDCSALLASPSYDPWDWAEYRHMADNGSVSSTLYLSDGKLFWSCAQ